MGSLKGGPTNWLFNSQGGGLQTTVPNLTKPNLPDPWNRSSVPVVTMLNATSANVNTHSPGLVAIL
jgi:hypothetical protein